MALAKKGDQEGLIDLLNKELGIVPSSGHKLPDFERRLIESRKDYKKELEQFLMAESQRWPRLPKPLSSKDLSEMLSEMHL